MVRAICRSRSLPELAEPLSLAFRTTLVALPARRALPETQRIVLVDDDARWFMDA